MRKKFRPQLEALEDRLVPATITWRGGHPEAGLSARLWGEPTNWQGGNVPTITDDVVIPDLSMVDPIPMYPYIDTGDTFFVKSLSTGTNDGDLDDPYVTILGTLEIVAGNSTWTRGKLEGTGNLWLVGGTFTQRFGDIDLNIVGILPAGPLGGGNGIFIQSNADGNSYGTLRIEDGQYYMDGVSSLNVTLLLMDSGWGEFRQDVTAGYTVTIGTAYLEDEQMFRLENGHLVVTNEFNVDTDAILSIESAAQSIKGMFIAGYRNGGGAIIFSESLTGQVSMEQNSSINLFDGGILDFEMSSQSYLRGGIVCDLSVIDITVAIHIRYGGVMYRSGIDESLLLVEPITIIYSGGRLTVLDHTSIKIGRSIFDSQYSAWLQNDGGEVRIGDGGFLKVRGTAGYRQTAGHTIVTGQTAEIIGNFTQDGGTLTFNNPVVMGTLDILGNYFVNEGHVNLRVDGDGARPNDHILVTGTIDFTPFVVLNIYATGSLDLLDDWILFMADVDIWDEPGEKTLNGTPVPEESLSYDFFEDPEDFYKLMVIG